VNEEVVMERLTPIVARLAIATILIVMGPRTEADSAWAADPIKIGFGMSLTGGLAVGGKPALVTFEMWRQDVNAKGGLLGRPVDFVYYDDQTNPSTVPAIYTKLLDVDRVDLVVSGYGTNLQAPAMPIITQRNLLFMCLFGLAVNDQFNYPRFFQIQPNGPDARSAASAGFLETAMTMNPKPKRLAIVGADAEFPHVALEGARDNAKSLGLGVVYDRTYPPNSVDFAPIIRSIQATDPDVVYVASYPPDSVGITRAANEIGLRTTMFGGAMIGLQFAPIKAQLGPLLNGIVAYELYVPEPTMSFPGIEDFLKRYQERAGKEGIDSLGFYLPPFAYAEMQILEQAVMAVGSLDQGKLADYIHTTTFKTVVGDIKFGPNGEWAEPRFLFVQYRKVAGNDVGQFRQAGKQVILYPPQFKSGELAYPYNDVKR
jgi:branched-chain amino acid transport system substrate-binding protein